ncbi:MAG: MFS transporter [Gammaproteobacteria bacterium]|nr:MFS transporter [Gammaproteobacteria bacterium]
MNDASAAAPANLTQRLLSRLARIEPGEGASVAAAFLLFFFVLGSYFSVRPVRETVATVLGADRVADLWLYTAAFSILIVPVYGLLVGWVRRGVLLPCIYGAVAITLAVVGTLLGADEDDLRVGTFFYVWISVLNLLLVSIFWSFLLEMFDAGQSKRLFGFIAAGGTLGALVGPAAAGLLVRHIGNAGVLYMAAGGFIAAIACQRVLLGLWKTRRPAAEAAAMPSQDQGLGGNPLAGISIVLKSPYLLGIAAFVTLLSLVNTTLYFEQLRIVNEAFSDREQRTQVFATIDVIVQSLTILSQLFLTGLIASRLGVRTLLTAVPVALAIGFLALMAFNAFGTFAILALMVLRRWGEYAFIRPGREMLWSRLDTESKYKAKSFIDVPVYRAADYVGAQANTALTAAAASPVTAALVGAGLAAVWAVNGWWLGRRHDSEGASR